MRFSRPSPWRSRREHIIGVSVSDTIAEMTTAIVNVSANSRNMRPTRPLMNSSGMNTAISDSVSEITVKPISRAPFSAACSGLSPFSMWRTMFSIMTMASSTTKPVPIVSAISERLSSEKPQNHMTPKVAISDTGSATPAIIVALSVRRKISTTITTSPTLRHERELHVAHGGRDGAGAIVHDRQLGTAWYGALDARQLGLDAPHRLDDVGAGLAVYIDDHRRHVLIPAADAGVLQAVDHLRHVLEQHGRVVAPGDDHLLVGVGIGDLVVGRDGVGLVAAVERALGARHVGGGDGGAHVRHAEAVGGEPRQVGLDAHGRLDAAFHRHVADPRHGGQPLRHQRVGEVGERTQRDGLGRQRQRDDRRVGRVQLRVGRRVGQVARQRRPAALMAACTSWAAASMSRLRVNCSVIWLMP